MSSSTVRARGGWALLAALCAAIAASPAMASVASLKGVSVPEPENLGDFVKDRDAAIKLGKALFWDQQVGSDGTACASCHFHAGADPRSRNQLSPGLNAGDTTFQPTLSGGAGGPNYRLKKEDFPFHVLADKTDRNSDVVFDSNDVASSPGQFHADFVDIVIGATEDSCDHLPDPVFHVNGTNTRQVEPRNTPTVINAALNFRNFWDGRANETFNGVDPFGRRNPDAKVLKVQSDGSVEAVTVELRNSSLASQSVGPPLSNLEMSCAGRTFRKLGQKMMVLRPLQFQRVSAADSVLGRYAHSTGFGMDDNYPDMIRAAFHDMWWSDDGDHGGFTQMESNFALFWGLALQMYQSTLISDDTRFDRAFEGKAYPDFRRGHLSQRELDGLAVFTGKGKCANCHAGPEFTKAGSSHLIGEANEEGLVERMLMGNGSGPPALYDNGFYNIGVRPTNEDIGLGGEDPWGNPLSFTRQYLDILRGKNVPDSFQIDPCKFEIPVDSSDCSVHPDPDTSRVAVDGAFKTPGLRNIELTGPFFHNGGYRTLREVVEFYNRGGDRRGNFPHDTTGTGPLGQDSPSSTKSGSNLDPDITSLELTELEIDNLVRFMVALTDDRVRYAKAPFDHPELLLHHGHPDDETVVTDDGSGDGKARDNFVVIEAVGRDGRHVTDPLKPFLHNDYLGDGDDENPEPPAADEQGCRPPIDTTD